jgi:hypothetical protein
MARAHGARSVAAFAFETTYGTAPASGFTRVPFAQSTLGAAQALVESELVGYGRDPLAPTPDAINVDGDITVPLDARFIGFWLKLLFGAPTTTEDTGVYTHVWKTGSFALASAAIELGAPEVPSFAINTGVRADELSINMTRGGQLTAQVKLIGQGEALAASTAAGSLATLVLSRFSHFSGYVHREGSALANVTGADLTYSNGLERIETIRADGLVEGVDAGMASLKGALQTRFADTTLLTQAINGEACSLEFGWTKGDYSLKIEVHEVYLPRPKREIPGPSGIMANFDWVAALNAAEACMATVTLVNDKASY